MKIPWSTVEKRWPQQGVVQFLTYQHLSYASNPRQIQKKLMEALKSLSSRARKRWTHKGRVQFQETTRIHLNYASYNYHISRDILKKPLRHPNLTTSFPYLRIHWT